MVRKKDRIFKKCVTCIITEGFCTLSRVYIGLAENENGKVSLKLDLPTNSSLHLKEQQQSKNSCSSFHAATQVNCAAVLKDKTTYRTQLVSGLYHIKKLTMCFLNWWFQFTQIVICLTDSRKDSAKFCFTKVKLFPSVASILPFS